MKKLLFVLVSLFFGCGSLGSSDTRKRFTVEEGMELAPGWGLNLNKSRIFNGGARIPQRNDVKKLFKDAKPISGNATGVLMLCRIKLPGIDKLGGYDSRVDPLILFSDPSGAILQYPSEFNVEQVFLTIPLVTLQNGTYKLDIYDQARVGDSELVGALQADFTGSLPLNFKAEEQEVKGLSAECRGMDADAVGALFDTESAAIKEKTPQVKESLPQALGQKTNDAAYNRDLFDLYDQTQQLAALAGWQDARVKEHVAEVEAVRKAWDELVKANTPKEPN